MILETVKTNVIIKAVNTEEQGDNVCDKIWSGITADAPTPFSFQTF